MSALRRLTARTINKTISRHVSGAQHTVGATLYRAGWCGAGYYTLVQHPGRDERYIFFKTIRQCERWHEIMTSNPAITSRGVCFGIGEKEACGHCFNLPRNCTCYLREEETGVGR